MPSSDSHDSARAVDSDPRIHGYLRRVAARFRHIRLVRGLSVVWAAAALAAAGLWLLQVAGYVHVPNAAWMLGSLAALACVCVAVAAYASFRDSHDVAERIERSHPDLQQRLVTAVSMRPDTADGRFGFLQRSVIDETVRHAYVHQWTTTVPTRRFIVTHAFHFGALLLSILAIYELAHVVPHEALLAENAAQPTEEIGNDFEIEIEPGNTEVEKGTSLIVAARFGAAIPGEAALVWSDDSGAVKRVPMTRSLDDPLFAARIGEVADELTYRVEFSQKQSDEYRVTVFEFPKLLQSDAHLSFPGYTQLPEKTIEDTRRVSVVEGTRVTWFCHLNKPVALAELVDEDDEVLELKKDGQNPHLYSASVRLTQSRRWKLRLVDEAGRENTFSSELSAQVVPNEPPELKLTAARDARVSPLEEFPVQGNYWDDYGLIRYGLTLSLGGDAPQEITLGDGDADKGGREVNHLVDFEALQAEPDNLLSYHLWAEDTGPDGEPRRVFSDMFFAEVRHFEEIFREGQPPPGGQSPQQGSQNAGQADELANLQKEIINGTWNVIRRETGPKPSEKFADDVELLRDSQRAALQQLEQLAQQVSDPQSGQYVEAVREHMTDADEHLSAAFDEQSAEHLHPALTAGQASYQALLKLRAREHQIVRGQQSGGGGGGSRNQLQQQIQELELKNEENRYETQSRATAQMDEQQREMQQALSRLKELARRQADVNEQLKKLQTALEAAATEEEQEDIRRQLKRLREQQEQMLRDTDELLDRMERPQNQRQMSESRQQLEETRENVRRSSEAMQQGDVPQALSAGTRAERQFEQMREEFRNQTSNQFTENMQDMVEQARRLDEQQEKLSDKLTELGQQRQLRVGDRSDRDQLDDDIEIQRDDLDALLEAMQDTVEQAENTEPLLAEKLYDSYRETKQRRVDESLEGVSELLRRGLDPQAREVEQKAREGISRLRKDVEEAAESVLGDEVETLRRAMAELDDLTRQLNNEIEQSDPQADANRAAASEQSTSNPADQQQRSQPQPGGSEQSQPSDEAESQNSQEPQDAQPSSSDSPSQAPPSRSAANRGGPSSGRDDGGLLDRLATDSQRMAPLTGGDFVQWSDRLRDVEEMIGDRDLSNQASRIRDRAREFRRDFKRHGREPQWSLVREMVAEPLEELKQSVSDELLRRSAERNELVPIDRDPVPDRYADRVRRYYEELGSGK